jgi:cytidine deaminase
MSEIDSPDQIHALIAAARTAAANAYAPYSGFGVGAAILLSDGTIISGCNFENASYGMTICAEAVALGTANSAGRLADIVAIAIIGGLILKGVIAGVDPVRPCGRCRQIISEVSQLSSRNLPIYCASADGSDYETHSIDSLLPFAFGPRDLGMV